MFNKLNEFREEYEHLQTMIGWDKNHYYNPEKAKEIYFKIIGMIEKTNLFVLENFNKKNKREYQNLLEYIKNEYKHPLEFIDELIYSVEYEDILERIVGIFRGMTTNYTSKLYYYEDYDYCFEDEYNVFHENDLDAGDYDYIYETGINVMI